MLNPDQRAIHQDIIQRGDALTLLQALPDGCTPLVFFDPQHRAALDKPDYGNEGARQRGRAALPAMSDAYILACLRRSARVIAPSGYLMLWCDTYRLSEGSDLQIKDALPPVDLI